MKKSNIIISDITCMRLDLILLSYRVGAKVLDAGKSLLFDVKRTIFVLICQRFLQLVSVVKARTGL